jgi:signal transduction histidine kinase
MALLVPCGIVIFFGSRTVRMEQRFARSLREDRLRATAEPISRQVEMEMTSLKDRTESKLCPLREPAYDRESAEDSVRSLVQSEELLSSGVLFDGKGRILGPPLDLPFRTGEISQGGETDESDGSADIFSAGAIETKLHRLAMRHRIASAVSLRESEPMNALSQLQDISRKTRDEVIKALAGYYIADLRLGLGDSHDAITRAEDYEALNQSGPTEGGIPLRGLMYLLRARAWKREGFPGRALEILIWFWDELLGGSQYELDMGGFGHVEGRIWAAAEAILNQGGPDTERWRERLEKRRELGRRARERAGERLLLAREVLPRIHPHGGAERGSRFRSLLLEDRLEVFLYFPPSTFELGLAPGETVGAGFRLDVQAVLEGGLAPLLGGLSNEEARVGLLDQGNRPLVPVELGPSPMIWPLPEPFASWRVAVSPGESDPEGHYVRTQMVFHAVLVAWAIAAVLGAGFLMMRSWRRATELAALRSEFVSMVTHDLKTPLTAIRMFNETLRMGRLKDPVRVEEYYGFIGNEVERLERLIDNILEFARIEAGRMEYSLVPLDLTALVKDVLVGFGPSAEAKGFTVSSSLAALPPVRGDEEALVRALWNLLSNAVKFSGEEKWVGVKTWCEGSSAVLEVSDRGIGITPGDKGRVFEKFHRGSNEGDGSRSGTGLGLALVRHTVQGHNGDVRVESEPGKGSRFRVVLPLAVSEGSSDGADPGGRG